LLFLVVVGPLPVG